MTGTTLTITDRFAATDVVDRFFWLVDSGRAAETSALFTSSGTLTFGPGSPKPGTVSGPDLAAAMSARQAQANVTTRHVVTHPNVVANDDSSITVCSLLTLYRSDDEGRDSYPTFVADVEDVLIREGDDWRIGARTISPIFYRR